MTNNYLRNALAFVSGALITFSLAPFNFWGLSVLSLTAFITCLSSAKSTKLALFNTAFWFGIGLFAFGVSWVFVSIHDFGFTGVPLALLLTGIFVIFLALVFALPFWLAGNFLRNHFNYAVFLIPAVFVIIEWLRMWIFTGFPWLIIGYSHINSWLSGWAPIFGVLGLSFLSAITSAVIWSAIKKIKARNFDAALFVSLSMLAAIWLGGKALQNVEWSQPKGQPVSVALVQPNIDLLLKWDPYSAPYIREVLAAETAKHWNSDLVIWPEAAVPLLFTDSQAFLGELNEVATRNDTALVTGLLYDQYPPERYYNAIIGLGNAHGLYFKQRLVPFGEYVPLESWLRGLIAFFDLPNSVIHKGPKGQQGLYTESYKIAPYICYEIVYPELVANNLGDKQVIVTISNDAWFGRSIGPKQHFQMAQMRALENSRYLLRSTNTGLSGVINHKGKIVKLDKPYQQSSIASEFQLREGNTPFSKMGTFPVIGFCFTLLACIGILGSGRKHKTHNKHKI